VLWTEFFRNRDWPVAAAIAMLLLAILTVPIIYARYQDGRDDRDADIPTGAS
jgi:putrescine transport system permease protein